MKYLLCLVPVVGLLTACGPKSPDATIDTTTDQTTTKTTTTVTTSSPAVPVAPVIPVTTLTQANLDRVQTDMSKAEVQAIFGQPSSSQTQPIPIVGGEQTTYTYQSGNSAVTIIFKNDHVKEKSGTFNP